MVEAARNYTPMDILTTFGEDQTIAATGYLQEDAADKVLTVGHGRIDGMWVIDVTAIEVASTDETYVHRLLGANVEAFSGDVEIVCTVEMGAGLSLGVMDSVAERYEIPFSNSFGGKEYKYLKHHVTVGGAIATGIVFSSWLSIPKPTD